MIHEVNELPKVEEKTPRRTMDAGVCLLCGDGTQEPGNKATEVVCPDYFSLGREKCGLGMRLQVMGRPYLQWYCDSVWLQTM